MSFHHDLVTARHTSPDEPPVTALTGCCPRLRRAQDPTPAAWLRLWAARVQDTWAAAGHSGLAHCLNWSEYPLTPPSPLLQTLLWTPGAPGWPPYLSCLWALGVLDRVVSPRRFLRQAAQTLVPQGILACTYTYWDASGTDCTVGAERRQRIYNARMVQDLVKETARPLGLALFGGADWRYRGDACGDYTIGTLVLQKRQPFTRQDDPRDDDEGDPACPPSQAT